MIRKELLKTKISYNKVKRVLALTEVVLLVGMIGQNVYADSVTKIDTITKSYFICENDYAPAEYGLVNIENENVSEEEYIKYKKYEIMEREYRRLVDEYYKKGEKLDISIEDFEELYNSKQAIDYSKYIVKEEKIFNNSSMAKSSSGGLSYYENTGTSRPSQCDYSSYDLLTSVVKGDYIYQATGSYGLTGHIAIVEGKFYDAASQSYYIRVIEADNDFGVARGVLDDTRLDREFAVIRRVKCTITKKKNAVDFAISQLGKPYDIDSYRMSTMTADDWYCSELVWAAYVREGIELDVEENNYDSIIMPRTLRDSAMAVPVLVQLHK